jgi:hypothetical protein
MDAREALLRAATYLKWFRDDAINLEVPPPEDLNEIIGILEQLADQLERGRTEDPEFDQPSQPRPRIELPEDE